MKTIKMNGREIIKISIDEERALRNLRDNDYAVRRSDRGLPLRDRIVRAKRRKLLGIYTSRRRNLAEEARDAELMPKLAKRFRLESESPAGKREARFFEAHSRVSHGLFGNPRRINLILKKLEEAE